MSEFKIFDKELAEEVKGDIEAFLSLRKKTLDEILKFLKDGLAIAEIVVDHEEVESVEKIATLYKIDEDVADGVFSLLKNLALQSSHTQFQADFEDDMKVLGFKTQDIKRVLAVADRFRKAQVGEKIAAARDKASIVETVLPYLVSVSPGRDQRYIHVDGKVKYKVPLLIMRLHLREGRRKDRFVHFQMDIGTIKKVIKILNENLKALQTIE